MQKKNLLGGALLLLCTMFVLSGCNEIMSNMSNPVNAYLQLKQASVKIYRGQSFKMSDYYSTISDAKPIFKSADESIVSIDENGIVTGGNRGTTTVTIEIPANEYYNGATIELEVEVDALLVLPKDAKELALDEEYNLGVTSVSSGAITYVSSNTDVATVDADGNVTAKGYGDATITVSIAATPEYDRTESAEFAATVRIQDFNQLKTAIANVEAGGTFTALLGDNAAIVLNEDLDLTGKKVTIKGNEEKPANIANPTKSILIDNDFELVNVVVENNAANFVKIKADASELTNMKYIKFDNVEGKNMQKPLFKSAKNYLIDDFSIVNSKIEMSAAQMVIDFSGGSAAYNVNIENSTFYNTVKNKTTFYKGQSGQKLSELDAEGIQTFNVNNNTFYNWGYNGGSDPTNWWTHRQNSQKWMKYNIKANIFVNCGKSGQAIRGINAGGDSANPTWDVTGNVMNWGGADTSGSESTTNVPVTGSIAKVVNFKDAANGDFTQSDANAGDPRWYEAN